MDKIAEATIAYAPGGLAVGQKLTMEGRDVAEVVSIEPQGDRALVQYRVTDDEAWKMLTAMSRLPASISVSYGPADKP